MTPTFQAEKLHEVRDEAWPMLEAHFLEASEGQRLDPDWSTYEALELAGALRIYTIRSAGDLLGYAVFVVSRMLHDRTRVQAVQDVVYVAPAVRGIMGGRFLRWCEAQCAAERVSVLVRFMPPRGWRPFRRYVRRLDA